MSFDGAHFSPLAFDAVIYDGCIFDPAIFQAVPCDPPPPVVAGVPQGLTLRAMQPVAYNGPTIGRISAAQIEVARRLFAKHNAEDEWLLGLIPDDAWIEV